MIHGKTRSRVCRLFLAAFSLVAASARAADSPVAIAAPPAWVSPLPFERLTNAEDLYSGLDSSLLLRDLQINARARESFHHEARQLLTMAGVQAGSQLSIDFEPGRQSLALHWVKIWRGSNVFDKLVLGNVKIIQPERDLDHCLFTSQKEAVLLLEDVRVGDTLEYAYTILGDNPVGGAKSSGAVVLRKYEPVERLATRLIWPQNRPLYLINHGADASPLVKKGDLTEYLWDYKKVPGLQREEPLPSWYDPLPWVQWSEFQTWSEVNQWALTLFTNSLPLSPDLTRQIKEWARLPDAQERVLAVLRFVQEEVRYQGVESGPETCAPADPSLVFARRFGDCKDKTLFCVTVLRALGIEAWPVLVATGLRQSVQDWQPTPAAFDHSIVLVPLANQNFWLDPTASFERGPLAARAWPNYGRGLILHPKTTGLAVIPESPVQPRTTVLEYVVLRRLDQPADLKVVTISDGPDAQAMRKRFATTDRSAIAAEDLNAFAALYPGIVRTAPMEYSDDEMANEVVVTENFQADKMWSPLPTAPGYVCRFYSYNVDRAARKPPVSARSMPLGLTWPEHQVFRAEITLPVAMPVQPGVWPVNSPAFHFHKAVSRAPGKILLEFEYDSLAEAVPVEAIPGYLGQLDLVARLLGHSLFSY